MKSVSKLILTLALAVAPFASALAQTTDPVEPTDPELTAEDAQKFASRDLLTETFLGDALAAQADAQMAVDDAQMALDEALATTAGIPDLEQALTDAQTALSDAEMSGTATPDELAALQGAVDDAQMALDDAVAAAATPDEITALEGQLATAQGELDAINANVDETTALIEQLSDEQVFALNRSLNNALASKLPLVYDAAMLQPILDGDYNRHQINAYTQGLEQEARFLSKADRFQAKYDDTGQEHFMTKVDRFTSWAQAQKDKFFAKVDRFADGDDAGTTDVDPAAASSLVEETTRAAARDGAQGAAKNAAKQAAKAAARDAAKQAAQDAASKEARRVARAAAKDSVKEAGKSAENKGKGKKGS